MAAVKYYDMTVPEWPKEVTVSGVKAWVKRAVQVYPMCYIPHTEAILHENTIEGMENLVNGPLTEQSVLRYLKAVEKRKALELSRKNRNQQVTGKRRRSKSRRTKSRRNKSHRNKSRRSRFSRNKSRRSMSR